MAEVSKRANHSNIGKPTQSISKLSKKNTANNKANNKGKKKGSSTRKTGAAVNANPNTNANAHFVSQCVLWQTNPRKVNYTIYVKIVIHAPNREAQEVRFPYQPDRESLESVIDELVDALQLHHAHHRLIVNAIQHTMKTTRMRIVRSSPIQSQPAQTTKSNNTSTNAQNQNHTNMKNTKQGKNGKNKKSSNVHQEMATTVNNNLSPKKHGKCTVDFDDEEYMFSPLSPLVISPRIIHRKSAAKFPNLRIYSQSMSESDPLSLMKQIKYDEDLCYNSNSQSNSASNSRRNSQLIDDHYMEKILHRTNNLQENEEDGDEDAY